MSDKRVPKFYFAFREAGYESTRTVLLTEVVECFENVNDQHLYLFVQHACA